MAKTVPKLTSQELKALYKKYDRISNISVASTATPAFLLAVIVVVAPTDVFKDLMWYTVPVLVVGLAVSIVYSALAIKYMSRYFNAEQEEFHELVTEITKSVKELDKELK